jgi:hypothetical protein
MASPDSRTPDEGEDLRRVSDQIAGRLRGRNILLTGREGREDLAQLEEAVERFEAAVESHGGDLMMDEAPEGQPGEPDDPHFALPRRSDDETVGSYLERLERATDEIRRHPRKPE